MHVETIALRSGPEPVKGPGKAPLDRPAMIPPVITEARSTPSYLHGGIVLLGNFDGFHKGHQALLAAARDLAEGSGAPIGVMSVEPHPRTFFGKSDERFRLTCWETKREILARHGIDFIYSPRFDASFAAMTPDAFAARVLAGGLRVRHVVVGEDFRFGARRAGGVNTLTKLGEEFGFGVTVVATVSANETRFSSSLIRCLIAEGDMVGAAEMLGMPWFFSGSIAASSGNTARLRIEKSLILPPRGVYIVTLDRPGLDLAEVALLYVGDYGVVDLCTPGNGFDRTINLRIAVPDRLS